MQKTIIGELKNNTSIRTKLKLITAYYIKFFMKLL